MPTPLHTPRVNNNDDTVRLVKLLVRPGDRVHAGQLVAEVETDKANFTVESDRDGYVLAIDKGINDTIDVGSVLLRPAPGRGRPTLKAAQLLAEHRLDAGDVPASGDRLTVADVERFLAARSPAVRSDGSARARDGSPTMADGVAAPLTPEQRGMLRTVVWQRDEAVPGYVELAYDAAAWDEAAAAFQKREGLVLSPLLALMAHRLACIAAREPRLNSTIVGESRHLYRVVNLGFTVQTEGTLYLTVVRDAAALTCRAFIDRLGRLQRGALAHALRAEEVTGATVAFSSMARWNVSRHVPVLPPFTSLVVAHAAPRDGVGTLGATYDHRVLTGYDALAALRRLSTPEELA